VKLVTCVSCEAKAYADWSEGCTWKCSKCGFTNWTSEKEEKKEVEEKEVV